MLTHPDLWVTEAASLCCAHSPRPLSDWSCQSMLCTLTQTFEWLKLPVYVVHTHPDLWVTEAASLCCAHSPRPLSDWSCQSMLCTLTQTFEWLKLPVYVVHTHPDTESLLHAVLSHWSQLLGPLFARKHLILSFFKKEKKRNTVRTKKNLVCHRSDYLPL